MPLYAEHPAAFDLRLPLAPFVQHPALPLGELLREEKRTQLVFRQFVFR